MDNMNNKCIFFKKHRDGVPICRLGISMPVSKRGLGGVCVKFQMFLCCVLLNFMSLFAWNVLVYTSGNGQWAYNDTTYEILQLLSYGTEVTVPKSIGNHAVQLHAYSGGGYEPVFANKTNLVSVTIPAGVNCSPGLFSGCRDLMNVHIASSHETLSSINGVVYNKDGTVLVFVPNARMSFLVSTNVTNVNYDAFSYCTKLSGIDVADENEYYSSMDGVLYDKVQTRLVRCPVGAESVHIQDTVKSIETCAFSNCGGLTDIVIPDGVTNIGNTAFGSCTGLTDMILPEGIVNIGGKAFYGCSGLLSVIVPDGVTDIESSTFEGCLRLTSMKIPSGVTNISGTAFAGCTAIRSVAIPQCIAETNRLSTVFPSSYQWITNVEIAVGTSSLGSSLFSGCRNLRDVTIPESVTSLSTNLFKDCTFLNEKIYTQTVKNALGSESGVGVRYALGDVVQDRTIVSVSVDGDAAIDEFVLVDGKVFDCVLRIVNTSDSSVRIFLPDGYEYESFIGAAPLILPARSTNMLTITRTGERTFLVTRRQLKQISR